MSTSTSVSPLVRAALIGVLSGSRSATPLAVLALHADSPVARGDWQRWRLFRSASARGALVLAGAGELVGDKVPATPGRVDPGPLIGRVVTGAVAGIALGGGRGGSGRGRPSLVGAVAGALGAVGGSWLFYLARKAVVDRTGLPDLVVALAEDAVAISGSVAVVRSR